MAWKPPPVEVVVINPQSCLPESVVDLLYDFAGECLRALHAAGSTVDSAADSGVCVSTTGGDDHQ